MSMMRRSAVFLTLGLLSCDSAGPTPSPPPTTHSAPDEPPPRAKPQPMAQAHRFLSSDQEFYADDADALAEPKRDALLEDGFEGLAIDAPFSVDVAKRSTLPVFGVFARPAAQPAQFTDDAMVVVVERHGPGFVVDAALRSDKGEPDDDEPAGGSGTVAEAFVFDARERLTALPWAAADVVLYVVHQGVLSNGIGVALQGRDGRAFPPAAKVESTADADVPSGERPLALDLPATAPTEPGGEVLIRGRLEAGEAGERWVHLLVLGSNPTPFTAAVSVGEAGTFSVNLLGENPLPKAPGTWHVYAFSGDHVAGPATIELTPGDKPW